MVSDSKYLPMIVGALFVAFLGFLAFLGKETLQTNGRLTRIETSIAENRTEREAQIADLRQRVSRIEDRSNGHLHSRDEQ